MTRLNRFQARARAIAHLALDPEPHDSRGLSSAVQEGAVLEVRKWGESWRARLWLEARSYHTEPRPPPDRYLVVTVEGIEEQPPTASERGLASQRTGGQVGRPRELPKGVERRPRMVFTPDDQLREDIEAIMAQHGLTAAEVVLGLCRAAQYGEELPWEV